MLITARGAGVKSQVASRKSGDVGQGGAPRQDSAGLDAPDRAARALSAAGFADQATQSSDTPWPVGRERDVVTIRTLIILALLVSGFLAGTNIDRALVLMPAWQQVGVSAWAEFSRHANLGNGLIVYPLAGFSAT